MKYLVIILAVLIAPSHAISLDSVNQKNWIHGSEDCKNNQDPAIDVFQFDESTYILRQNKCLNFEAPFIYVLFGEHTVFVQDTGATAEAELFPLYETVQKLITEGSNSDLNILVTHSHGDAARLEQGWACRIAGVFAGAGAGDSGPV